LVNGTVNAAELGGIAPSGFLQTGPGAPNPQTVANELVLQSPLILQQGTTAQGITVNPNLGSGTTISDTYGSNVILGWNISGGAGELDVIGAPTLDGDILRIYGLSGSASPYDLSATLFGVDRSGDANFAGTITTSQGELGSATGTWTPANGTFDVAAQTKITVAATPSAAILIGYQVLAGYGTTSSTGLAFAAAQNSPVTLYDGTYGVGGAFILSDGYLYFVTGETGFASTEAQDTIGWAVS
jgi:hypothetical protein